MKRCFKWALALPVVCLLPVFIIVQYMPAFLAFQKPVDSYNFLIESWIAAGEIEQAVNKGTSLASAQYYLTGFQYPISYPQDTLTQQGPTQTISTKKGFALLTNGSFRVKLHPPVQLQHPDTMVIKLIVAGSGANGVAPHFNVVANNRCVGGAMAPEMPDTVAFTVISTKQRPEAFFIRFNNDLWTPEADRNLFLSGVLINDEPIALNQQNLLVTNELSVQATGFASQAAEMADYLLKLGVSPAQLHVIAFETIERNQTLASARQFKKYLAGKNLESVNIVSSGLHSRRTWHTYKTLLPPEMEVGVIRFSTPLPAASEKNTRVARFISLADETFAYLANWILLH